MCVCCVCKSEVCVCVCVRVLSDCNHLQFPTSRPCRRWKVKEFQQRGVNVKMDWTQKCSRNCNNEKSMSEPLVALVSTQLQLFDKVGRAAAHRCSPAAPLFKPAFSLSGPASDNG